MKFKKITLKNIRSYDEQEINFPDGSILLSGDIGSGKTSILLAIEYALFGLQPGQTGSALLRNNRDFGEVALEMEIGGRSIIIERKLRRKAKSVTNEYASITLDGEKVESSVTELKTKILELLGYPIEFIKKNNLLYRYTVYTPQEEMKQIILEDAETRLNILRHVFGIDKYKRIRENMEILLTYLKENSKQLQGEIKFLEKDMEKFNSLKAFQQQLAESIASKDAELLSKVSLRKNIESESIELEIKIKERENFRKEMEKASLLISTKNDFILSLSREIDALSNSISKVAPFNKSSLDSAIISLSAKASSLDSLNNKLIELNYSISSLEKNSKEAISQKSRVFAIDICPTCLQDVPEVHKHNILNKTEKDISEIKSRLEQLQREKTELSAMISKTKAEKHVLESEKFILESIKLKSEEAERAKVKRLELAKQKEMAEKDISLLQKHLESLKNSVLEFSRFDNFFKLKQDELKKAFRDEKNTEISLAELRKEKEITIREMDSLKELISLKEGSKKKLAETLELSDWLSKHFLNLINFTEMNVMMKLRIEFSRLFSRWFHILVPENTFEVHLDESFTPLIVQNELEMDYSFLSGGERTALALAYRLALNQTINSVLSQIKTRNIIILDEPTDGFSEVQLERMRDVLNELNAEQIILVSHEQKIEAFVDNVLRLKKQNSSSSLESTHNQKT